MKPLFSTDSFDYYKDGMYAKAGTKEWSESRWVVKSDNSVWFEHKDAMVFKGTSEVQNAYRDWLKRSLLELITQEENYDKRKHNDVPRAVP